MARYLSIQYPNNKPAHQCGDKRRDKRKGDDSKSKDKDSDTGVTAGANVEDTTTTEESTASSGAPSIGAHISETNVQSFYSLRTVEEILQAHPMNDDDFWGDTKPTDVFIDTINSKVIMAGSHIKNSIHTNTKNQFQLRY